jgi:hypothetical protein
LTKQFWFVDATGRVLRGEEARVALEHKNDAEFLTEHNGIVSVPQTRWKEAQEFEQKYWLERVSTRDDRNEDHAAEFAGYGAIRNRTFSHAIELGCGPFTNLRIISSGCFIQSCSLLDPLIGSYLDMPNCRYNQQALHCDGTLMRKLAANLPLRIIRRGLRQIAPQVLRRGVQDIPIKRLVASSIEDMQTDGLTCDLIVIINVIEHCYDIHRVFENIKRIAATNAILVFADKYYEPEMVSELVHGHYYEAGHPLMVGRQVIDAFLNDNFVPLYQMVKRKPLRHIPVMPYYDAFYFIGQLKDEVSQLHA